MVRKQRKVKGERRRSSASRSPLVVDGAALTTTDSDSDCSNLCLQMKQQTWDPRASYVRHKLDGRSRYKVKGAYNKSKEDYIQIISAREEDKTEILSLRPPKPLVLPSHRRKAAQSRVDPRKELWEGSLAKSSIWPCVSVSGYDLEEVDTRRLQTDRSHDGRRTPELSSKLYPHDNRPRIQKMSLSDQMTSSDQPYVPTSYSDETRRHPKRLKLNVSLPAIIENTGEHSSCEILGQQFCRICHENASKQDFAETQRQEYPNLEITELQPWACWTPALRFKHLKELDSLESNVSAPPLVSQRRVMMSLDSTYRLLSNFQRYQDGVPSVRKSRLGLSFNHTNRRNSSRSVDRMERLPAVSRSSSLMDLAYLPRTPSVDDDRVHSSSSGYVTISPSTPWRSNRYNVHASFDDDPLPAPFSPLRQNRRPIYRRKNSLNSL
ncbi:uncharacterized protein [Ptychodera flava]|uniref:uncharacterized protein n=1 Tax=Ptychodera flava TaxID=63121 RepID=UPI003969F04A